MRLSENNRTTLLTHLHKVIEETANIQANNILNGKTNRLIEYPPNGGLTSEEKESLEQLKEDERVRNALRKIIASSTASVFFDFFNIIDGTGDPDPGTGKWSEVMLVDKPENFDEDTEFLHDHFFETYWAWKEKRKANFNLGLE